MDINCILSPSPPVATVEPPVSCPEPQKPPKIPSMWRWFCHLCNNSYPIACTRRCLHCAHELCYAADDGLTTNGDHCQTAFDYYGWSSYNQWRRGIIECNSPEEEEDDDDDEEEEEEEEIETSDESDSVQFLEPRQQEESVENLHPEWLMKMRDNTHDCTIDCAYPTDCLDKLTQVDKWCMTEFTSTSPSSASKNQEADNSQQRRVMRKARKHRKFLERPWW